MSTLLIRAVINQGAYLPKKVSFYLNLNKTSGVPRLMPGKMLRIEDHAQGHDSPWARSQSAPSAMYIKVPALPSLNPSSTQSELDHNGLKQTEAELNRIQFSICYNGWLLSMFCAKENLKHRRKARGDQIGTTQQKNHNVGIQRDVSTFLESVRCPLCELSCFTVYPCLKPSAKE